MLPLFFFVAFPGSSTELAVRLHALLEFLLAPSLFSGLGATFSHQRHDFADFCVQVLLAFAFLLHERIINLTVRLFNINTNVATPCLHRADAATLREAEKLIEACENCNPLGAETPFDNILDRVTGSDPKVTDYILEAPAKCPNCRGEVLEKTLVEPA